MSKIISENKELYHIFQPILQVDQQLNCKITDYEMLLRDQSGHFPGKEFLESLATAQGNQRWISLTSRSLATALTNHPERVVFINIEPCQLAYQTVWDFLQQIHDQYCPQVGLEITERRDAINSWESFFDHFKRLKSLGFPLAIDDVGSGAHSYEFVNKHLDHIKRIKLSLLLFRNTDPLTARKFVNAWITFAQEKKVELVIEGIQNVQLAKEFASLNRVLEQGFYWNKGVTLD